MIAMFGFSTNADDAVGGAAKPSVVWTDVAARAESTPAADLMAAKAKIDALAEPVRKRAETLLTQVAGVTLDAVGIQQAVTLLNSEVPGFFRYAPGERPGQDHPHGTAVRGAALLLLRGLLFSAGKRAKSHNHPASATAGILGGLRACRVFRPLDQAKLEEDLMLVVSSKVYFAAEQILADKSTAKQ